MKRTLLMLVLVVSIVLIWSGFTFTPQLPERKTCRGYEVIEAGKGINCYGDTIKLTKRSGFYEVASNYAPN